jgi:hypothetical protein
VKNNKFQEIRTQFIGVWRQFQPEQTQSRVEGESTESSITKVSGINDRDLFTEITTPISKLNLPTVNIDPWSAFWAILAAMVGGTGITSYLLLIAVPPTPNCQGIIPLSADGERLYCAQIGAETKEIPKIRAAVALVKGWTNNHPLYNDSQRLLTVWSQDLIGIAKKQLGQGNSDQAIATLKIIPTTSPAYERTQSLIAKWTNQAQNVANIEAKFEQAIALGNWQMAFDLLQKVQRLPGAVNIHKQEQMSFKLAQEEEAWDKLQAANNALRDREEDGIAIPYLDKTAKKKGKDLVAEPLPTRPEPLIKAIALANQIGSKTYVYQKGQALRNTWSKQLVHLSIDRYKTQNFNEAIAIAQKVPHDVPIYSEAQDWVKLNQASVTAGKRHLLALMDALAQVKQIPKTSSIGNLARTKQANWQGLLKQQTQLQWAKTIASIQQPATLALAIRTAKQVPAQSDSGKEIQSEIDTWSRQIETVDNRTIFAKATQLAGNGGSLPNLKAAVHLAGKITKDRPLGEEITTAVAEWTEKIQTIEDRPFLVNAEALARQGYLTQAIASANRIAPNRVLYPSAQADVRYWYLELQEVTDRQTLEQAKSLSRRGKLSAAIELAATISRRSPLYSEARSYLADWRMLLVPSSNHN